MNRPVRTAAPRLTDVRLVPAPLVAVLTVAIVAMAGNWFINWSTTAEEAGPAIVAGSEAEVAPTTVPVVPVIAETADDLVLVDVSGGGSPHGEFAADMGVYQGRFYVASIAPDASIPDRSATPPAATTLYVFDGVAWTSSPLDSDDARGILLAEELELLLDGERPNPGFVGQSAEAVTETAEGSYWIREASLLNERDERSLLIIEPSEGQARVGKTMAEILPDGSGDGYAIHSVSAGEFGLVVIADKINSEPLEQLLLFSTDHAKTWISRPLGATTATGVIVGPEAFLVLSSYNDDRRETEPAPVTLGYRES